MALKTIDYSLLEDISSVEDFLKSQFHCSSSKLKKYFDKKFLERSFKARSTLSLPLNFVNDGQVNPVYGGPPLEIIDEDEQFLVINKAPNVFVHPLSYDEQDNCLSFIRSIKPDLLNVNGHAYDRGLLYRLDYETSGVLIYVKEESLYRELRDHFQQVARGKTYRCWVSGHCQLKGSLTHSFSSSGPKGEKVIVGEISDHALKGTLQLEPVRYDSDRDATLMSVELESGLRHQIRAQMAFLGHPLLGDEFYGGRSAPRLYLHALSYRILVSGKIRQFTKKDSNFE